MKITSISIQAKNKNRVNISVDGKYRFSLDIAQITELGVRLGKEYTEEDIHELENESQFGKLYARALEYCLMRPRSVKEVNDYLWRKTLPTLQKDGTKKSLYSPALVERVMIKLQQKKYVDDEHFTQAWIENRRQSTGISLRKLRAELREKGVDNETVERAMTVSGRSDKDELSKIIAKKASRYSDKQKLIQYLMRQGFQYDDIQTALE